MSTSGLPCYGCAYRRAIPGDAHSRCAFDWLQDTETLATIITGANAHGKRSGWFSFPFNYDPIWGPNACAQRADTADPEKVAKPNPMAELFSLLGKRLAVIVSLGALLTGCATVDHMRYSLTPAPNECQASQPRTFLSTALSVVCWDANASPIGMGVASGTSAAGVTTSLIGAAATVAGPVAGAAILGGKLVEAAKAIPTNINAVTTGTVTTTGNVTATIPPVQVAPIQILGPAAP